MCSNDSIFALSSGRLPAAIAVIRLSGPQTRFALETLIGRVPEPRHAALARIKDPETDEVIDEGLVLWFAGPKSETGEDLAELQLHGGPAVVAAVFRALGRMPGFRMADGGEFTRRGFANGKLDLTTVEGLADLISAETEAQRKQAYRQLKGILGGRAEIWRTRLIEALALAEAGIDFSDEGDVPAGLLAPALGIARELRVEIEAVLADGRRGERLRDGLVIAIAGPPNAGKSSLFNRIARREAAIVTPIPGTTRDVIELHLDLAGYPVTLLDTAGIRETDDPIEQEGVRRARERAAAADLVLWVTDATLKSESGFDGDSGRPVWRVRNKIDLVDSPTQRHVGVVDIPAFDISAQDGTGFNELLDQLSDFASSSLDGEEPALISRERHRVALRATADALGRAVGSFNPLEEFVAEELRLAARELGRLTGRVDVEDILDRIFRDFCVGK